MKLGLDPYITAPRNVTAESLALARWYGANPIVQRLWAIKDTKTLRVVVLLEPTHDGDDVYPAWIANCQTWARELHSLAGSAVQLELVDESAFEGIEVHAGSIIVADVCWREATLEVL